MLSLVHTYRYHLIVCRISDEFEDNFSISRTDRLKRMNVRGEGSEGHHPSSTWSKIEHIYASFADGGVELQGFPSAESATGLSVGVDGCSEEGLVDANMASCAQWKQTRLSSRVGNYFTYHIYEVHIVFVIGNSKGPASGRTVAGGPLSLFAGTHPVLPHHVYVPPQHGARDGRHYEGLG